MEDIKVNLLLDMVIENDIFPEYYPVRVEDLQDQYVYMSIPMKKGRLLRFEIGEEVKCVFKNSQKYYGFTGKVEEILLKPIPVLKIQMPASCQVVPQRRNYVRLPVSLPVRFRPVEERAQHPENFAGDYWEGQTVNISAGGILLCTNIQLDYEQKIDIEFDIPGQDNLSCTGHVLRISEGKADKNRSQWVAIQYDNISPADQDKIFKYIFKKERESIQNGTHPLKE